MSKERAFVRYTKSGKIVPGSLILTKGSYPNGPGLWKEITTDLCCENNNTMNYKVYTAVYTHTDILLAPDITVLQNTLDANVTWQVTQVGEYYLSIPGGFDPLKTAVFATPNAACSGAAYYAVMDICTADPVGSQRVALYTLDQSIAYTGTGVNAYLTIEIRVYP